MRTPVFQFRKGRNKKKYVAGSPDGKPTHDGTVCVLLTINNIQYGPYATDIYTFRATWDARKSARPSEAAKQLIEEINTYAMFLREVYASILHQCKLEGDQTPIDGEMVITAMNLARKRQKEETRQRLQALGMSQETELMSLEAVYDEFMQSRKKDVQPDRHKRKDGQISQSTYETYPKRWEMIRAYLLHINRKQIPVRSIKARFGEQLKDFLKSYKQKNGKPYEMASINKCLSLLKMLMVYAQRRGHIQSNPVAQLSCRGGQGARPKPLTEAQMQHLETAELPKRLRWVCDSWLIAAELCLHYSDYMKLPRMTIITAPNGKRFIQHDRSKQRSDALLQTVDITPRAERILAKYDISKLYYRSSKDFSVALKMIAIRCNLTDGQGNIMPLQFGQGRDTGLTSRVIAGANGLQLTKLAGWSNPRVANRYIGLDLEIVQAFAGSAEEVPEGVKG